MTGADIHLCVLSDGKLSNCVQSKPKGLRKEIILEK